MSVKLDLIITVVNRGFADEVMAAARSAGAGGGTIINGRGLGMNELTTLFGAAIEPEKELVLILAEREKRNEIMQTIAEKTGLAQKGMGLCFSLPVDGVKGISRYEE